MDQRICIASGAQWEDKVGYSRAVRIGNYIEISGTVAIENGKPLKTNNLYEQTKCILGIIKDSLEQAGATLEDVIRTRIYTTNISAWEAIGKAHGEFFEKIKPATSMVEVNRLISDEFLVEIEATAVLRLKH